MTLAEEIREKLNTGSTDIVRAVIYARVSTDNEGQKESCANQVSLAEKYIAEHPNVQLIATYIDDGISGKNDFTRPQYNEMLQRLSDDGFDLILTKALSRLNRDELNSLMLNSMLLEHNATVLTLEDRHVHDFEDMNSGLLHSIKYAIDAQYVKQQSLNGRKTQELRIERKELSAKDCSFGYDWHREDKSITINLEQAEIVRRIFEEYVYRNGTPASIERALNDEGINICSRSVSNIIKDERYIGKFYINKRTTKLGTGRTKSKRIELPKEQWVLCERPNLQIVDTELFELAQRIHHSRITVYEKPDKKTIQAHFQGMHLFASKIFCPVCGKPYRHDFSDRKKTISVYRISNHRDCPNKISRIYEADLEEMTRITLKQVVTEQSNVLSSVEKTLIECVEVSQNNGDEVSNLKKQRSAKEKKKESLFGVLMNGALSDKVKDEAVAKLNTLSDEIDNLTAIIEDKESNKLSFSYVTDKISEIKTAISELKNFSTMDRDRILNYIDRIDLPPNGDVDITLKSGQIITFKQQQRNDFSDEESVGKKGIQDVLYWLPAESQKQLRHGTRQQ